MRSARVNCSLTTEFNLVRENILLQNERITQVYVIQSEQNPLLWFGVLLVDAGLYMGATIRFNMIIDETYPDCSCPRIVFEPAPYHPLVNPLTGELDTKNAFPDWNSNFNKLYELLLFVKRVIRNADEYIQQIVELFHQSVRDKGNAGRLNSNEKLDSQAKNSIEIGFENDDNNFEALCQQSRDYDPTLTGLFSFFKHTLAFVETYQKNHEEFRNRIEDFKNACYQKLFDRPELCGDDKSALVFTPWDTEVHEPIRNYILAGKFTPTSLFASYHKETESVSFIPGNDP